MITILADDITGAAEIAGVCLRCGMTVSFGVNQLPTATAQVRVIATDSRSMSAQEARMIHRELAEAIGTASSDSVFKKTDSVLRGYVVDELDEWMTVLGFEEAVLQPSNPSIGRCIVEGQYSIDGIELHATDFSRDSDFPAWTSAVEGLLMERNGNHTSRKIYTGSVLPLKKGIHVPDCTSVEDLKKSVFKNNPSILHAGSAAFFAAWLEIVHDRIPKPQPNGINPMLEQCAVGELLLEGGATTFALLEMKGWSTLTPLLEYSPGIVRMAVTGKPNLFLTLKPGSYPWPGWEGTATECPDGNRIIL